MSYILILNKKASPSRGFVQTTYFDKRFDSKVNARKFAIAIMTKHKQYFSIYVYPTSDVGEHAEWYGNDRQTFSFEEESIHKETVKNRIIWYTTRYKNGEKFDEVLNKDGTLTGKSLESVVLARDPKFYDYDWDALLRKV